MTWRDSLNDSDSPWSHQQPWNRWDWCFFGRGSRQQRGQQGYFFRLGGKKPVQNLFFPGRFLPWFFPPSWKNLRTLVVKYIKLVPSVCVHVCLSALSQLNRWPYGRVCPIRTSGVRDYPILVPDLSLLPLTWSKNGPRIFERWSSNRVIEANVQGGSSFYCPPPHKVRKGGYWIRHRLSVRPFTLSARSTYNYTPNIRARCVPFPVPCPRCCSLCEKHHYTIKAGDTGATRTLVCFSTMYISYPQGQNTNKEGT